MIKRILFSVVLVAVGAVGFYLVDRWLRWPRHPRRHPAER